MGGEQLNRRLAAILAADVVGYSRLMETNEERTLGALRQHRREFFDPTIAKHSGRIFKVMGDGFLVEFGSVINAARCAVEIQRGMQDRNIDIPEDRHIKFRIGINLGDIIVDDDDFYGDGVNMAARLEGLAGPGGIACSAAVRNQIGNKLELEFIDQGEKTVKNFSQPVHVYFVEWGTSPSKGIVSATAGRPAPMRLDRPSVAILPFSNMSNEPEQEYFSDGITEDIITDLSKVSGLFVLGRNTAFVYKGKAVDLKAIANQLGVAFLVEGSVRKSGNRVRINAQLVDGVTGGHLWADRYDRDLTDIFAVQDEISTAIVEQLKVRLLPEEKKAIEQAPTGSIEAYAYYLRGRQLFHARTKPNLTSARRMFVRATELDPLYARAHAGIADCDSILKSSHSADVSADDILTTADKALSIDPLLAEAHAARGAALVVGQRRDEAASAFERALALDPNCYEAHDGYAQFFARAGDFEPAIKHYMRALEIKPDDYWSPISLASIFQSLGRQNDRKTYARLGLKRAEETLRLHPEEAKPLQLGAIALVALGERDRATDWVVRALAIDPDERDARYNASCVYSLLGETDRAMDLLETVWQQMGPDQLLWIKNDSDLDPIRSHPRYRKLVASTE